MAVALATNAFKKAAERRKAFMQETSRGIHAALIDRIVTLV
jgi:hypothetical protein